jgi:hypothetical protein
MKHCGNAPGKRLSRSCSIFVFTCRKATLISEPPYPAPILHQNKPSFSSGPTFPHTRRRRRILPFAFWGIQRAQPFGLYGLLSKETQCTKTFAAVAVTPGGMTKTAGRGGLRRATTERPPAGDESHRRKGNGVSLDGFFVRFNSRPIGRMLRPQCAHQRQRVFNFTQRDADFP